MTGVRRVQNTDAGIQRRRPLGYQRLADLPRLAQHHDRRACALGTPVRSFGRDGVQPRPGTYIYSYDDPLYAGDAYYAEGHHPRSFWARYVWVGLRNRASQLSKDLGEPVAERPVCISGNPDIHRNGPYGHFLLKSGNCYHYKSINRWHGLALIRSYGYKLEIVRNSQDGTGLAAAVAIGRSLKRRKA